MNVFKLKPKLFYLLLLVCSIGFSQKSTIITSTKAKLIEEQKTHIAKLTGEVPIKKGLYLKSRGTDKERKLARVYLREIISDLQLDSREQTYRMPNVNSMVDLIIGPFTGANVYTILPATIESGEYVVLGGHYDSEVNCPGAIDNATGIIMAYHITKKLSELKIRKKNVILVFFDQEEEDNVGSKAFIKLIRKNKWNIHSVHAFDMMGWDENNDKAIEIALPSDSLRDRYVKHSKIWDKKMYETTISSSDYYSFVVEGFNTIGAGECYATRDTTPYIHTSEDTFETVNFEYLALSTLFIYDIVKEIITE